jgi:hypothetical protein
LFGYFKALSRLSVIEHTLIELSKRMEAAETDWTDMHSRCRKLMLRAERRAEREQDVNSSEQSQSGEGANGFRGRALTPQQMKIQQDILRRRAGVS